MQELFYWYCKKVNTCPPRVNLTRNKFLILGNREWFVLGLAWRLFVLFSLSPPLLNNFIWFVFCNLYFVYNILYFAIWYLPLYFVFVTQLILITQLNPTRSVPRPVCTLWKSVFQHSSANTKHPTWIDCNFAQRMVLFEVQTIHYF